jgi:hypothetical protein
MRGRWCGRGGRNLAALAAALVLISAGAAESAPKPRHIVVGLDLSSSFPLISDPIFAQRAGARIAPAIRDLPPRSLVTLRTFGVYDPTANPLRFDKQISSVNRPGDVAVAVETIIASIPKLIKEGRLKAHGWTNIVAFLETVAPNVNCRKNKTTVILVSDGIEDSDYARLTSEKGKLPPPKTPLYAGCDDLQFIGIGVGANRPALTEHLRGEWANWANEAGFKNFSGLYDW